MQDFTPSLSRRAPNAHKGRSGAVLIVAGSGRYAGAAALAGLGAARAGAGFVRLAVPRSLVSRVAAVSPAAIVIGQRETWEAQFSRSARDEILDLASAADAVVLGPGLGRSNDLTAFLADLLARIEKPLVLDADGLFALAELGPSTSIKSTSLILTPHSAEAARLLSSDAAAVEKDRSQAVIQLTERFQATVVLKGPHTEVAESGRRFRNTTGNAAMATAGMGDVLSGIIGTFLAAGLSGFEAAANAVWIHGRAGDLARDASSLDRGLLPEDLTDWLPSAIGEILS